MKFRHWQHGFTKVIAVTKVTRPLATNLGDVVPLQASSASVVTQATLVDSQHYLDKRKVAKSFSDAAAQYDDVAQLQRDIGESLFARMQGLSQLDSLAVADARWLDIGSGTGYFSQRLAQAYPQLNVTGLDIAQGMLAFAKEKRPCDNLTWLCGDAESLPLASNSVDLAFSSLAIQWCQQPHQLFAEIARVLKPSGVFVFATLGPQTLHELKAAWQHVDDKVHVNQFLSWQQLSDAAARGFEQSANLGQCSLELMAQDFPVLHYQKVTQLTHELKTLGAHNVNQGQNTGLTGRKGLKAMMAGYEAFRDSQGRLPATYEVYLGCVTKAS